MLVSVYIDAQAVCVRSRGTYFEGSITTLTSGTKLESTRTTVVIRRHVAIRIYKPKVVTHFLSPRTSGANFMNNRYLFIRTCICTRYMIIGMDYHIEQVPMCCRVCGQRLWKAEHHMNAMHSENSFWHQHFWGMMLKRILKVSACSVSNLMVKTINAIMNWRGCITSVQSVYFSGTNIHYINARYNVLYLNNTII